MPLSAMTWGLVEALSLICTVPDFCPVLVGEKVTLMVQVAFAAKFVPQVEVLRNCPFVFIEAIVRADLPLLVMVTVWGRLVVPTFCFPKRTCLIGKKETCPVLSGVYSLLPLKSAVTTSSWWSPLKSPRARSSRNRPIGRKVRGLRNVPSPLPTKTWTHPNCESFLTDTKSGMPSPFMSPTATADGKRPLYKTGLLKSAVAVSEQNPDSSSLKLGYHKIGFAILAQVGGYD